MSSQVWKQVEQFLRLLSAVTSQECACDECNRRRATKVKFGLLANQSELVWLHVNKPEEQK